MIQRIQSFYLLMASACLASIHMLPLAALGEGPNEATMGIYRIDPAGSCETCSNFGLPYISGLAVLLLLISIFMYSNRRIQIRLVGASIFLLAVVIALLAYYYHETELAFPGQVHMAIPLILPLPALIFAWLAVRSIRKDEELVKAADRIR